ncbi:ERD2 [Symbiodinium necroappetens]|uniref:ERD2 protein n=1 Tax=Symbiodinium necroappetens TaxID=1628268 RepID=A0A812NCB8_9DINO|nr:ERD2 [Symbiodinium necroappetens]
MLGGYRVFYALNWIYKKINMPRYSDIQSWIGGLVEIMFFLDFLNYRFTGNSILRSFVLKVDTKINEISDQVESKVLGSTSRSERADTEGGEMRRRRKQDEDRPMEDSVARRVSRRKLLPVEFGRERERERVRVAKRVWKKREREVHLCSSCIGCCRESWKRPRANPALSPNTGNTKVYTMYLFSTPTPDTSLLLVLMFLF